ncbi:patatin-like phospholipase family protein [Nocardioides campestrisoli]|uniref:patatin-like phospholipase family protein n=1 Tax=Nocardioides campestrisoli TaxID=2736757 RepID=UPI00163D76B8|nr:patatin-like phospholipase family protein [Nocardioides campestrisoli]
MTRSGRVVLALGGGGARGYAHIGVIQVLEEQGYEVVGIAGTSMGALVGGLHAAGCLDGYTEWVGNLSQRDVLRLLDPALRTPGMIRGERVMGRVADLLDGARIEDLPIPFTAVATDLLAHREVWFQRGPVEVAVRASIALPSFFTPVMLNGRLLADGGMCNPVPMTPLGGLPADLRIAVTLSGEETDPPDAGPTQESAEDRPLSEWYERLRHTASQVLELEAGRRVSRWFAARRGEDPAAAAGSVPELPEMVSPYDDLPDDLGVLRVMELSIDSLQRVVARYQMAGYPPDLQISVPKNSCRTLDFHRAAEMMALGRSVATDALARLAPPPAPGSTSEPG